MNQVFKYIFSLGLFFALASNPALSESKNVKKELVDICEIMVSTPDGGSTTVHPRTRFRVTNLTNKNGGFVLPSGTPESIKDISCERESIIPLENDYKILMSGLTLIITTYKEYKVAIFEFKEGELKFKLVRGEISENEKLDSLKYINSVKHLFK